MEKKPENLVFNLKSNASKSMWKTAQAMGKTPPEDVRGSWEIVRERYWSGVRWMDHAAIETNSTLKAVAWGRSATDFSEAIAISEEIQRLCREKDA